MRAIEIPKFPDGLIDRALGISQQQIFLPLKFKQVPWSDRTSQKYMWRDHQDFCDRFRYPKRHR